jgi:hypothetical protein
MPITLSRGCLYLIGDQVTNIVNELIHDVPEQAVTAYKATGAEYHLTIFTAEEVKTNNIDIHTVEQRLDPSDSRNGLYTYGLGCLADEHVWYAVCSFPAGNRLRQSLGLPLKDFHITLGYMRTDCHTKPKNLYTLVRKLVYIPGSEREILADPYHVLTLLRSYNEMLTIDDLYHIAKYHIQDQEITQRVISSLDSSNLVGLLLELNSLKTSGRESEIARIVTGRLLDGGWTLDTDIIPNAIGKVLAIANRYVAPNRVIIQDMSPPGRYGDLRFIISHMNCSK